MLTWLSANLRTGDIMSDLPDLDVSSVSDVMGGYASATATLPLPSAPEAWVAATTPGAAVMVLVDVPPDGGDPRPLWGGFVTTRERGDGDTVALGLATLPAYFDRVFVGDHTFTATDQNAIVETLVAASCDTLPIRVEVVGAAGTSRDRTYADAEDKTLLSALSELMGVDAGPEWFVGWEYDGSGPQATVTPVLYVGTRLGASPAAGLEASVVFDMPGCVTSVSLVEDFTAGRGATSVIAVSTATTGGRPQSPAQSSGDVFRPRFEYRFTPSTSISQVDTLTGHAVATLAQMRDGARSLSLSASLDLAPALGYEWALGDVVGYEIGDRYYTVGDSFMSSSGFGSGGFGSGGFGGGGSGSEVSTLVPVDSVPGFPGGIAGTGRVWGFELTLTEPMTVSPVLVLEA